MKIQKIGLFFGSFNPIHHGHLMVASFIANHTELQQVWLVVSPQNPFKKKSTLADPYDRLEMLNLALEDAEHLRVTDIEFHLPIPSYTIDTLTHLKAKYPNREFVLLMGEDSLESLEKSGSVTHPKSTKTER